VSALHNFGETWRGLWAAFFIGGNTYVGTIEGNGMTQKAAHGFGTCKQQGEWAELCFMARAAGHGLRVSKPYGDSASYDVGVEWVAPGREGWGVFGGCRFRPLCTRGGGRVTA
jgi:hypothetical protein